MKVEKVIKIIIFGKYSYIGESIYRFLSVYDDISIDIVETIKDKWKEVDLSQYDVVVDVAGIAHIKIKPEMKEDFYRINTDMTIEMCKKAKENGVKQFIFLSSMNVYGDYCGIVTKETIPNPSNFYGDSKLKADQAIQKMNNDQFSVVSIRPPAVYGKGCKGNFPFLQRYVKKIPFFPAYKNKKSMIYIDNLCEFIRLIIKERANGIFCPQNKEYTSTFLMIKTLAEVENRKMLFFSFINPCIHFLSKHNRTFNRAFADDAYDLSISKHETCDYCICDFRESIERSIT